MDNYGKLTFKTIIQKTNGKLAWVCLETLWCDYDEIQGHIDKFKDANPSLVKNKKLEAHFVRTEHFYIAS
jgi:hypothetical protein